MARQNIVLSNSASFATGTAQKTILQLVAPATQVVAIKAFGLGFEGTSVTQQPVVVFLARQSTAGTATARNPLKKSMGGPAVQSTGQENASVEPTTGDIVWGPIEVHPQGTFEKNFRPDDEILMDGSVAATQRLALLVVSAVTVNMRGHIDGEE